MSRRTEADVQAVLAALCTEPEARLIATEDGRFALSSRGKPRSMRLSSRRVRELIAQGLLAEAEGGGVAVSSTGAAWLRRRRNADLPFRAQHDEISRVSVGPGREALANLDESPIAALARGNGRPGSRWLQPHAATAAERLRRDFEMGRLQPRVTANWSASVSDGPRNGDNSGLTDLTDMALAARMRFDRAIRAVGPELSGVLIDVCCFLKGLQTVEHERQWPARSAKLVLRLALDGLARHYGFLPLATGRPASGALRHWGAEDYRPDIT